MTHADAIANLIAVLRRYLDRMPRFVAIAIERAIQDVEETAL